MTGFHTFRIRLITVMLITVCPLHSFEQVSFGPKVRAQTEKEFRKLPLEMQREFADTTTKYPHPEGVSIFTEFTLDTLNKDPKALPLPKIVLLDPRTNEPVKAHVNEDKHFALDCYAELGNDTLFIQMSTLWGDQVFAIQIHNKIAKAYYQEQSVSGAIYKLHMSDALTTSLVIPGKTCKLTLSDSIYKVGHPIFGRTEIITDSYFKKDDWEDGHFYHLRWRIKCYFKIRLSDFESMNSSRPYDRNKLGSLASAVGPP
jgi:hypothetical protein